MALDPHADHDVDDSIASHFDHISHELQDHIDALEEEEATTQSNLAVARKKLEGTREAVSQQADKMLRLREEKLQLEEHKTLLEEKLRIFAKAHSA